MKKISDFRPINCNESEIQYVIQDNYDYSTLNVGFQWRHQATKYISQLNEDLMMDDELSDLVDDNQYEVIHISKVVKEEVDWGQTIIKIAIVLFVLYVLTHIIHL
ncbi:hypothetical protein SLW70_04090 [Flavobacterium sp. NG2]|uniref:hypothetical protein n=1 Tax=Flavobacterium sp. NG2 TaxID=3097547 RepID=UPI002A823B9C|nr:hypothetical protein [Flavobacterium sp. NG2]WPR72328.1 hypothetical protein SLW70_04090 [Flavobacterium sp. NG2]